MYSIYFYKDKNENQPVLEFMRKPTSRGHNGRLKLGYINNEVEILKRYGVNIGDHYLKHVEDDIWVLEPIRNRMIFVTRIDDNFILLHHFLKKSNIFPKREIEQAKLEYQDLKERGIDNE